jgi:hypothetical protein
MIVKTSHALFAIVLLGAAGFAHGKWTHRWSEQKNLEEGQDLLATIEQPLGAWAPGKFLEINVNDIPKKTKTASRQFINSSEGKSVTVSLTSGTPGIVAAHTPDVCYLGAGYKLKGAPTKETVSLPNGQTAMFYVADFQKTTSTGEENIRIRWTWTADGTWYAPDYPRLFFAKSQLQLPVLYKLYVVHTVNKDEDLTKKDEYRRFSGELASALGQALKH